MLKILLQQGFTPLRFNLCLLIPLVELPTFIPYSKLSFVKNPGPMTAKSVILDIQFFITACNLISLQTAKRFLEQYPTQKNAENINADIITYDKNQYDAPTMGSRIIVSSRMAFIRSN